MIVDDDGVVVSTYGVFLRTPYNYDRDAASVESGLDTGDESKTQQQFREECDINTIVERFGLTGELPQNVQIPLQSDFMETTDYQTALNALIAADEAFMQYPASIRERFQNDPGKFVEFVSDAKNVDQAREWGLAHAAKKEPEPMLVRIAPEGAKDVRIAPEGAKDQ